MFRLEIAGNSNSNYHVPIQEIIHKTHMAGKKANINEVYHKTINLVTFQFERSKPLRFRVQQRQNSFCLEYFVMDFFLGALLYLIKTAVIKPKLLLLLRLLLTRY